MIPALLKAAGISIVSFAATNIDDIFVLMAFFSNRRFHPREVVLGQYAGIIALILVSIGLAALAIAFTPGFVRYLGLFPIFLGLKALWALRENGGNGESHADADGSAVTRILTVAAVTFANGGDNIGVYTPLFSTRPALDVAGIITGFLLMTAAWCLLGHYMVNHPLLKKPITKYGRFALPLVLLGIGVMILFAQ